MREVVDSSPTATRLSGYTCGLKKRDDKLITGFRLYKRIYAPQSHGERRVRRVFDEILFSAFS